MVNQMGPSVDVFHALAHDARRGMVERLASHELTISELAQPLDMTLVAASKHVRVLERAGLVNRTIVGRQHRCRLRPEPLREARDWLADCETYWSRRLDLLETLMAAPDEPT